MKTTDEMMQTFLRAAITLDFEKLLEEVRSKGVDLHTYFASKVLEKDMDAVTREERACSKQVLFAWVYTRPTGLNVAKKVVTGCQIERRVRGQDAERSPEHGVLRPLSAGR